MHKAPTRSLEPKQERNRCIALCSRSARPIRVPPKQGVFQTVDPSGDALSHYRTAHFSMWIGRGMHGCCGSTREGGIDSLPSADGHYLVIVGSVTNSNVWGGKRGGRNMPALRLVSSQFPGTRPLGIADDR